MGIKQTYISDITGKEITEDNNIYIYKTFSYDSKYGDQEIRIITTKEELEYLFGKKITAEDSLTVGTKCFIDDNFDIIKEGKEYISKGKGMLGNNIMGIINYITDMTITITLYDSDNMEYYITIGESTIDKYFLKYLTNID